MKLKLALNTFDANLINLLICKSYVSAFQIRF